MFSHKYRYIFITTLAVYTYINTVLCEVYKYFHIEIEWYFAFATIFLVTLLTWEGSRLFEPFFNRQIRSHPNKIKWLIYFLIAGSVITTLVTTGIVLLVSMIFHKQNFYETTVPLKLNIIYAWLANLLFHIQEVIAFNFVIGKYFALRAESDKANQYLENIKGIDEDHIFVKQLQKFTSKNSGLKFYQKVLNKLK